MITVPENMGLDDMSTLGDYGVLDYLGKKRKKV